MTFICHRDIIFDERSVCIISHLLTCVLSFGSSLYILDTTGPLPDTWFKSLTVYSLSFYLFQTVVHRANIVNFDEVYQFFPLRDYVLAPSLRTRQVANYKNFLLSFSNTFIILHFTFNFLIHFKLGIQ